MLQPIARTDEDREHWSRVATEWITWARAPRHDAFWAYSTSLTSFIGRGPGAALDVGCGEGRVSRELLDLGFQVTALDPVDALMRAAAEAQSADMYIIGEAVNLPFAAASFDLILAYNVLMDVADVPASVKEMRRVMRQDGRLVISIVHPFTDRGRFVDEDDPDSNFVLRGTYFGRRRFEGVEKRNGLRMPFAGWSQPLAVYAQALEAAGLAITSVREPVPASGERDPRLRNWTRFPAFLWLEAQALGA